MSDLWFSPTSCIKIRTKDDFGDFSIYVRKSNFKKVNKRRHRKKSYGYKLKCGYKLKLTEFS